MQILHRKFWNRTIPSRCILNGLSFEPVPTEIVQLNQHERVLIQGVTAFQVITRMQTVAGKCLPTSHKVSKVKGSTFHLPLPLNETLSDCLVQKRHFHLVGNYTTTAFSDLTSIKSLASKLWNNALRSLSNRDVMLWRLLTRY